MFDNDMAELLGDLFASRTRANLIAAFAMRPGERLYLREVARLIKADVRAVKVELDRLERIGLLKSEASGNRRYMQVNQDFPLYPELKAMALKTLGLGENLRAAQGHAAAGDQRFSLHGRGGSETAQEGRLLHSRCSERPQNIYHRN